MEVSTEISQKIRSAIKAKLMELGAYVDDELPDYIMVMVANKRSRTQMNKDLGLFLGTHTSLFTQWLHSLLVKLQTIKSDLDKSADKHGKGGKLKAVRNKQKGDRQVVDGLASITKDQESVHNAEDCVEKTQPDSGSGEGDKYQHVIDSREAGSSTKLIIKTENDDSHNVKPDTITSPVDAVSEEGEAMETEVVTSRSLGIDTNITSKMSSASQSPSHMQSYSVNRKRKMTPELGDTGKESGVFHPYNPAFDTTTSELTTDNSSSLQVTRKTSGDGPERTTHNEDTELPEHDDQPPQKLIRLSESVQLEDIKRALAEVLEKNAVQNDDIGHFSRMLESSLRKLRPQDLTLAKMRIQQVLCEFETVAFQGENMGGNQQTASIKEQTSCLSNESRFNRFGKYSQSLIMDSRRECIRSSLEDKNTSASPQTDACLLQKKELHENSDHQVDNEGILRPKINSDNLDNHLTVTCEYSSSDSRVNSEPHESHVDKVIFHSKAVNSRKSSSAAETAESSLKVYDSGVRFGDKLQNQSPQSPVSLGKAVIGSPSSVHSCPVSNTLSLQVKRNFSSTSQESTVSPVDLQSRPGSSHIHRSKVSAKNKILPSILVNSIHNHRQSESAESVSVLRQSLNKDSSPRPAESSKHDNQDSPKLYGPEALKVMAKNLRITVINKRAVKSPQESSSDDSDDEEDEDSSDNDDEEDNVKVNHSSITKEKTGTRNSQHRKKALLLQAVAEVEHSIAVKRRVSVTKPVCHDYSSEEYTPQRNWSHDCLHEENPPPYDPSKISVVDGSSHVDCVYKSKETRRSKCLPAHEDCRELISRCRREELLRSIGIVRDTSLPPGSFKPLATDMSCQEGDNKFTGKREVRDGNSSKNIHNFQIANSLASGGSPSQVEKHPPPLAGSSLHVPEGSASYKGTRTSITSRLGKLHMENKDSFDDDDGLDARNSRTGDLLFNSKLRDTINSINAQEKLNLIKSQKCASISSPYQEQHEKYFSSLTSRKQECSRSVSTGVFSGASSQSKRVEYTPRIPEGVVVQLQHQHSQETPPGKVQSYNLGDGEDPAEAGDQEPPLLVKNFSGDSRFDSDVNATRQSAEGDMKKHEQEKTRRGITFIVTLDGVDESQFHSEHAGEGKFGCEVDKSRQPVFEKVHTGHNGNMGSLSEKIECPVVSASVAVAQVVTSGLKQLCREHKLLDLQSAVARPEHLTFFQKVQSLKRAAVDPFLLPTESHPALHCLRDLGDDDAKLASLQTLGHYSTEVMLDEDDESTHQQQKLERCKFWPACAAGDSCGYYHPTTHCKMFPNCRFGDKCLFIHPNCRFDSTCVRPDCPYTHSSRRRPACVKRSVALHKSHNVLTPMPKPRFPGPSYSGSQSTCRYFPNCRNGNCPFVHPKPCRFGLACKSLSCPFLHPNVPDKRMLKWQARCGKMEDVPLTASSSFKSAGFRDHSSTRTSKSTKVSSISR